MNWFRKLFSKKISSYVTPEGVLVITGITDEKLDALIKDLKKHRDVITQTKAYYETRSSTTPKEFKVE